MMDMLPFFRSVEKTPEKKIDEIITYLIQFKEAIEFALTNITADNLSPDLVAKINSLGSDISRISNEKAEELAQLPGKINFRINYETGYLEYTSQNEEVNNGI